MNLKCYKINGYNNRIHYIPMERKQVCDFISEQLVSFNFVITDNDNIEMPCVFILFCFLWQSIYFRVTKHKTFWVLIYVHKTNNLRLIYNYWYLKRHIAKDRQQSSMYRCGFYGGGNRLDLINPETLVLRMTDRYEVISL